MKRIAQILFLAGVTVLVCGQSFTQDEKVFTPEEVDTKAVIKKTPRPEAVSEWDCPSKGEVVLQIVLHRSGKVVNVVVTKALHCGYDEKAIEAAKRIKFTPAIKNGVPVSQSIEIKYGYGS